ncbi:hypothetical protein GCK32_020135 [Trichostrongylus colubriformis]|uniref:Uncharacterized protein n=1 Tax=Trichostrongylus colubriformis TaxID=6319 RepID=A0AAN8FVH6_TRICO
MCICALPVTSSHIQSFSGYPLAYLHRTVIYKKPPNEQHAFIVAVGAVLHLFFSGKYNLITQRHLKGYLLVAYLFTESDNYDINWTTPYCVLTLRLTGLVMNVYDGVHYHCLPYHITCQSIDIEHAKMDIDSTTKYCA